MGNLVYFEDHYPGVRHEPGPDLFTRRRLRGESLIPLQLALGEYDIETCFSRLALYGRCPVFPRANPEDAGKILFLVRIHDAVSLNRFLLDTLDESDDAVAERIDLIQMLENCEESLLSKAWDRIGQAAKPHSQANESVAARATSATPAPPR